MLTYCLEKDNSCWCVGNRVRVSQMYCTSRRLYSEQSEYPQWVYRFGMNTNRLRQRKGRYPYQQKSFSVTNKKKRKQDTHCGRGQCRKSHTKAKMLSLWRIKLIKAIQIFTNSLPSSLKNTPSSLDTQKGQKCIGKWWQFIIGITWGP